MLSEPGQLNMELSKKASSFLRSHFGFVLEDKVYDSDGKEDLGVLLPSKDGLTRMSREELELYVSFMTGEKG